jgi:hypothetical protein
MGPELSLAPGFFYLCSGPNPTSYKALAPRWPGGSPAFGAVTRPVLPA